MYCDCFYDWADFGRQILAAQALTAPFPFRWPLAPALLTLRSHALFDITASGEWSGVANSLLIYRLAEVEYDVMSRSLARDVKRAHVNSLH